MAWIRCLRCEKFQRDFVARSFPLIAPDQPDLHRVSRCDEMVPNVPKHYEMHQNMNLGFNGMDRIPLLPKILTRLRCTNFCINCTVHPVLHRVWCNYETIPNVPKHYAKHQNMSLGSNGVDWLRSLRKIPTWLRGTNFCINGTSSPCFASSLMQLWNDPKCTQTLCNAPKHEF